MKNSFIAYYGFLISWLTGFAASILQFFITQGKFKIIWSFLLVFIVFAFIGALLNKARSREILTKISWVFIAGDIIIVALATGACFMASNLFTLSKSLTFVGIIFGLPSLLSLCYLWLIKR